MITVFAILLGLATLSQGADQLLFAQAVYRHGDRTPTGTYPNDPYNETFWGLSWGELTKRGMGQHFLQGARLRARYVDTYKLIRGKYNRDDVYLRSANTPRCMQSAYSNAAGLYNDSPTAPTDVPDWPAGWAPIPVHCVPFGEDRVCEYGGSCEKVGVLRAERVVKKGYLEYVATQADLVETILQNGGGNISTDFDTLFHIYQSISIEKGVYNLTLPAWITDDVYNRLNQFVENSEDYVYGSAGFGYDQDTEMIKLRGGFLLAEFINNLNNAKTGGAKLKVYLGHDYSLLALLQTLECKEEVIGKANPDYASAVVSELWKRDDGKFYTKFLYSDNGYTDYRDFTKLIKGCPSDSDFCLLDTFISRSTTYSSVKPVDCDLI